MKQEDENIDTLYIHLSSIIPMLINKTCKIEPFRYTTDFTFVYLQMKLTVVVVVTQMTT